MKTRRIGMLMGGHNAEHEVSMNTGRALGAALRNRGYQVVDVVVGTDLAAVLAREGIEVAFVALHGRWGEDGCVQGLLEAMRVPYTGSGVLASALSMDKVFAKWIFRQRGIQVVEDVVWSRESLGSRTVADLPFGLPAVVKPSREGSSVGVTIVREPAGLEAALAATRDLAGDVIVERYVKGREIQVAVLDDEPLGVIEIVPAEEFYDYKAKYHSGGTTQYLFPAPLPGEMAERVMALCASAHRALGCRGVSRVDTILSEQGEFYVLEVNTIPGMTEASLVPKIAAGLGLSFDDLAERLLLGAALKA
jgi:D-alanine-D-alanine ligase